MRIIRYAASFGLLLAGIAVSVLVTTRVLKTTTPFPEAVVGGAVVFAVWWYVDGQLLPEYRNQ